MSNLTVQTSTTPLTSAQAAPANNKNCNGSVCPQPVAAEQVMQITAKQIERNPGLLVESLIRDQVHSIKLIKVQDKRGPKAIFEFALKDGNGAIGQKGKITLKLNNRFDAVTFERIDGAALERQATKSLDYKVEGPNPVWNGVKGLANIAWKTITFPFWAIYKGLLEPIGNAMSMSMNLEVGKALNGLMFKLSALLILALGGVALYFGGKRVMAKNHINIGEKISEILSPLTKFTESIKSKIQQKTNSELN